MACIGIQPSNGDSEMEEGEIVDEVDDLSDISSEEEFLLRQRLEVLENYNNVLERKEAKKTSNAPSNGKRQRNNKDVFCDLSHVEETYLEDNIHVSQRFIKKAVPIKPYKRKKLTKEPNTMLKKIKDCKKKTKQNKKKSTSKVPIKSSDDSEDEYFNKRRRLADAVTLRKNKNDTTTLKDRISRMLFGTKPKTSSNMIQLRQCSTLSNLEICSNVQSKQDNNDNTRDTQLQILMKHNDLTEKDNTISEKEFINVKPIEVDTQSVSEMELDNVKLGDTPIDLEAHVLNEPKITILKDSINLCTDNESSQDVVDSAKNEGVVTNKEVIHNNVPNDGSDEDLELLREYALKTKSSKSKTKPLDRKVKSNDIKPTVVSEDEDSDTAELRMICLKSTLLKKAIEMKQKQKLRKRLSQSSCLPDDFTLEDEILNAASENNTDIESVDMDIGSDGEEKSKENSNALKLDSKINDHVSKDKKIQDDELEDDEDLLRAKLLTSLSKNLPNLVDLNMFNDSNEKIQDINKEKVKSLPVRVPEEKKIIIKLGESDSEGEHEATKNLTKMHMKLAEHYQDFQSKLDQLLKSTRKEFENDTLPDLVQKPVTQKPADKFVPKAMNHLPKSEQVEYKNLVKRMAELEKIKQARNSMTIAQNKLQLKDTLKPRNVSLNTLNSTNMEEKIALSRKKIAEESAKILKLKDEAKKLQQKYKIVATELKNISTAINLNKKQQRAVHSSLQQIRLQHQLLLKGSTHNLNTRNPSIKMPLNKVQKENNPTAKEPPYTNLLKSVKVSFVNDVNRDVSTVQSRLSVQLDVANNKKTVKLPKSPPKGRVVDIVSHTDTDVLPKTNEKVPDTFPPQVEKGGGDIKESCVMRDDNIDQITMTSVDDYRSPLEALGNTTWTEDPNAFLCPYEVGGSCRDPECKYLHPKIQSQ